MDARTAMRNAKSGKTHSVYVCFGQEKYLMQEFIKYMIEQTIPPEYRDLALSKYHLHETSLAEVLDDAETAPFMVPKKLIIADEAVFFTGAKDKSKVEHDLERFQAYLKSPAEDTILILSVQADKLDERKKIVKLLKEADALIPFHPMEPDALLQWIIKQAEKHNVRISEEAAGRILFNTGAHLQQVASELEKCCTFAGEGGEITVDAIDRLVPRTVEQNIFMLIDDIVRKRHEQAMTLFYELLRQREEPIKISSLIARQFRIVLQAKSLGDRGYSGQQMASQLGLHPYAAKLAYEQSRHYNEVQLSRILEQLAELDFRMKTGKMDKVMGLELFLLGLAA